MALKPALLVFVSTISCSLSFAADPFINILGGSAPVKDGFYYSIENSSSTGAPDGPGILENRIRSVNVISHEGCDTWGSQVTLSNLHFGSPVMFLTTGLLLPSNFYDVEVGSVFKRSYDQGRELILSLMVGSESDTPFYSLAEAVFQATGIYRVPTSLTRGNAYVINISNNRSFLNYIPLPGVAHYYRSLDGRVTYNLGFPFLSGSYELFYGFTVKGSFVGISQGSGEINQKLGLASLLYASYDWGQRSWLRVGRDDPLNRLFLDQQRVAIGFRSSVSSVLTIDISAGHLFARSLFESHSYYGAPEAQTGLDSTWMAQVMLGLRDLSAQKTNN